MDIRIYGNDARLGFCRDYLIKKNVWIAGSMRLLPIPTTKDGESLHGCKLSICDFLKECGAADVVVGYGIPRDFRCGLADRGAVTLDVSRDEEYLCENAELTAIGTVGRILTEEKAGPRELSVGVIGYGRIGQRIVRILMFLSGRVTVFTSKTELCEELCMLGVSGVDSLSIDSSLTSERLSSLDILINTAPARLIGERAAEALSSVRVIELASGDNIPEGINVERLASVPAIMYPASAGAALARSVLRMLGGERDKNGSFDRGGTI